MMDELLLMVRKRIDDERLSFTSLAGCGIRELSFDTILRWVIGVDGVDNDADDLGLDDIMPMLPLV